MQDSINQIKTKIQNENLIREEYLDLTNRCQNDIEYINDHMDKIDQLIQQDSYH